MRGTSRVPRQPSQTVDWITLPDALDARAVQRAVTGVDAIFHLAARVHVTQQAERAKADFRRDNVDLTASLLDAADKAGVRRFIFASSVKVMGEHSENPFTESMDPAPGDPYGASKLEAERLIAQYASQHGFEWCILRLPLVYGPGMRGNMLSLFHAVDRQIPLPFRGVHNRRSLLYSGNAAPAFETAAISPATSGETFFISDNDDISSESLVRLVGEALGKRALLFPVPQPLARAAAHVGDAIAQVAPFPLTSEKVSRLWGSLSVDPSRFSLRTGFSPPFTVRDGIAATARWYREH